MDHLMQLRARAHKVGIEGIGQSWTHSKQQRSERGREREGGRERERERERENSSSTLLFGGGRRRQRAGRLHPSITG